MSLSAKSSFRRRQTGRRRHIVESLEQRICLSAVRIVSWNTLNQPNNATQDAYFSTVFERIGQQNVAGNALPPTIVALQETDGPDTGNNYDGVNSIARIEAILEQLYPTTSYASAITSLDTGGDATGFVYDTGVLDLVGESVVDPLPGDRAFAHDVLRGQFRPDGRTDSGDDFYIYTTHLKAGGSDQVRRANEAAAIRADVNSLGAGTDVLVVGDFNIGGASENAYQNFLASGNGQLQDPIDQPGEWKNNSQFSAIHTQNPAGSSPAGMDDRFDFQLITESVRSDADGLQYIDGSYRAFGNDDTHVYNDSITTNNGRSGRIYDNTVRQALAGASDHLPVVVDYQLDGDGNVGGDPPGDVVISELMYNPASAEPANEWVEIVNLGDDAVDLSGWLLDDEDGTNWTAIAPGTVLAPKQVAVLHNQAVSSANFSAAWSGSITPQTLLIPVGWGSLANGPSATSEVLQLLDASGTEVDLVNYDDTGSWPADNNQSSIYLSDPALDNNDGASWRLAVAGDDGVVAASGASDGDFGSPGFVPNLVVIEPDTVAPKVIDVRIQSTNWTAAFQSGIGNGHSLVGPDQLRNLSWVGLDQIVVVFDEDIVDFDGDDFTLIGTRGGDFSTAIENVAYEPLTATATITLRDGMTADAFRLSIPDQVTDEAGNQLDGEWVDSVSTVSGNAIAGGDFHFRFDVLPGDVMDTGFVTIFDVFAVNGRVFQSFNTPNFDPMFDILGSGLVTIFDVFSANRQVFQSLPAPPPPPVVPPTIVTATATSGWATSVDQAMSDESADEDSKETVTPIRQRIWARPRIFRFRDLFTYRRRSMRFR